MDKSVIRGVATTQALNLVVLSGLAIMQFFLSTPTTRFLLFVSGAVSGVGALITLLAFSFEKH